MTPLKLKTTITVVILLLALGAGPLLAKEFIQWKGKPEFDAGDSKGYYIWADAEGWHVRWVSKGKKHNYSGTITCGGKFTYFRPTSKDKKDAYKQSAENTIEFDSIVSTGRDGIDFRMSPESKSITFNLMIDGEKAPVGFVKIGAKKQRPAGVPFTLQVKAE